MLRPASVSAGDLQRARAGKEWGDARQDRPVPLDVAATPGLGPLLAAPRPVVVPPVLPILLDARHRFRFPASSVKISQRLQILAQRLVRARLPAPQGADPARRPGARAGWPPAPGTPGQAGRSSWRRSGWRSWSTPAATDVVTVCSPQVAVRMPIWSSISRRWVRSNCSASVCPASRTCLQIADELPVELDTVDQRTLGTGRIDQIGGDRDPHRLGDEVLAQLEAQAVRFAGIHLLNLPHHALGLRRGRSRSERGLAVTVATEPEQVAGDRLPEAVAPVELEAVEGEEAEAVVGGSRVGPGRHGRRSPRRRPEGARGSGRRYPGGPGDPRARATVGKRSISRTWDGISRPTLAPGCTTISGTSRLLSVEVGVPGEPLSPSVSPWSENRTTIVSRRRAAPRDGAGMAEALVDVGDGAVVEIDGQRRPRLRQERLARRADRRPRDPDGRCPESPSGAGRRRARRQRAGRRADWLKRRSRAGARCWACGSRRCAGRAGTDRRHPAAGARRRDPVQPLRRRVEIRFELLCAAFFRCPVGEALEALGETVDRMHETTAGEGLGAVAGGEKALGEEAERRRVERHGVVVRGVTERLEAGEQREVRGQRPSGRRYDVAENGSLALARPGVERRRGRPFVAVERQMVGPQRVERDEHDVRACRAARGRHDPRGRSRQRRTRGSPGGSGVAEAKARHRRLRRRARPRDRCRGRPTPRPARRFRAGVRAGRAARTADRFPPARSRRTRCRGAPPNGRSRREPRRAGETNSFDDRTCHWLHQDVPRLVGERRLPGTRRATASRSGSRRARPTQRSVSVTSSPAAEVGSISSSIGPVCRKPIRRGRRRTDCAACRRPAPWSARACPRVRGYGP